MLEQEKTIHGNTDWESWSVEEWAKYEADLMAYQGTDRVVTSLDKQKEIKSAKRPEVSVLSGIPTIDRLIDGFRGGELIVISGPTKHGKTTLCRTLTRNFILEGVDSLWFSYELHTEEFLKSFPFLLTFYLPNELALRSIPWIHSRIVEAKLKHNTRAVFIDHLHFLLDLEQMRNPSIQIGSIVRKLKRLAIRHNVIIFLVSHLTKLSFDNEPTENDLRDSSFIAQEADSTFMVWRKQNQLTKAFESAARLCIRNHRRTGVMAEKMDLVYKLGWLEEQSDVENMG